MNTSQKLQIKVFGDKAKQITSGQIFVATLDSVEGHAVVALNPEEKPEWYQSIENLRQLAAFIQDKDGATALDTAEFLEKPWHWKEEWDECQKEEMFKVLKI